MSQPSRDGGFTLIELLVTMSLMGIVMAIAVSGYSSWSKASQQSGAAHELQSLLRNTQQRAVTEGQSMCVRFDTVANTYAVLRGRCDVAVDVVQAATKAASGNVRLASPAFTAPGPPELSGKTAVEFTSRGTAWPGSVKLTRPGATDETITVEGLTGRATLD